MPSYKGALDPESARKLLLNSGLPLEQAVAINKRIWMADIGSVADIRWLLPAAEIVEKILLAEEPL